MHQRKKNQNKENFKTIKRTTLQQINYTEQLHIPTYATMELRQAGRSIELKKSSSKKPASRKSRCISAKQSLQQPPLNIKQLLKQIKSMKLIRSKSKSPRLSKSKQKSKKSNKKITQTHLNSHSNSELNLTAKVERTLERLRQSNYFRDEEDSEIPLISTSQTFTHEQKKKLEYIVSGENFDDINIRQLRLFCMSKEPSIRLSMDYFKGNIYEIMARRIQRAWRRYRTHRLVERYVNILHLDGLQQPSRQLSHSLSNASLQNHESMMISSEQLYPEEMVQRKITYISNLEEEEEDKEDSQAEAEAGMEHERPHMDEEEDSTLYYLKKEQLEKWSEIVAIINSNKAESPQETEKLLKKLINQSEINRKNLQLKPTICDNIEERAQINPSTQQLKMCKVEESEMCIPIQRLKKSGREQVSSISEDSMKQIQEQFNSKKYIEYLDSDMYPIATHRKNSMATIGKRKQQQLLQKLQGDNSTKRLIRGSKILASQPFELDEPVRSRLSYRSNSELSSVSSIIETEDLKSSRKRYSRRLMETRIRKSSSQSNIKYPSLEDRFGKYQDTQQSIKHAQEDQIVRIINSGGTEPQHTQVIETAKEKPSLMMLEISQQQPRKGVEEAMQCIMRRELDLEPQENSHQLAFNSHLNEAEGAYLQQQFKKQLQELHRIREDDSDQEVSVNKTAGVEPVLHRYSLEIQRVSVQDYDRNIESEEDYEEGETSEKAQAISEMMINSLVIEFLVEVARYPQSVLKSFKNLTLKKIKIKRAPTKNKKNGFATNQAQIKSFIEQLCNYVLNEQPQVFKNLEKATGPSALQMLRYMHQSVESDICIEEQQDDPSIMILPNWVFENFWNRKSISIKYERQGLQQEKQRQRFQYLKGLNKIFLRSCFDCLNECLDYERNYGPFGKPFPWKRSHYFDHIKSLEETRKSVKNSQKRIFQISSTYCGIIIEKDEIVSLGGNEDYISQVQEDRLSRMLAQDLVEGEERWIFYDDEETELLVETSNSIFHEIFEQALLDLRSLNSIQFSY